MAGKQLARASLVLVMARFVSSSALLAAHGGGDVVWTAAARLETVRREGAAVGVRLSSGGKAVAELRFGPNGLWPARQCETKQEAGAARLRFTGFDTSRTGGTPRLTPDSFVEVSLRDSSPFPKVQFAIGLTSFDEKAWQAALPPAAPFYYLTCQRPKAKMLYLGGGLIATPEFEPYPFTRQGCISGNWSARWSYAAALAAFAVPAFGLWEPDDQLFVGYDFGEARHTDRSSKYLAAAYCAGEGRHQGPMICLVHPHQASWVDLTYPKASARLASRFEWIYSTTLGSDRDPNEFVLTRFVRDHAKLLRPAPAMNDLTWVRDPGAVHLPHAIMRDHGPALLHKSGPHYLEGAFCELDALMLGTTFPSDGVRRIYQAKDQRAIKRLREEIQELKARTIWKSVKGDQCCVWQHPLEGKFKDRWGGDDCTGIYHKSTWQIGTAMTVVYDNEKDDSLLPFIDGVYNWTKYALYTRNGVCDIPWSMFCHIGLAAGENFMLTYRQVFRRDPVRGRNLDEALRLARMVAYKSTWFYLADPDETDGMDPLFLGQAVTDRRWIGRVTWNECGWIPRTAIPLYCETGDPFLKYLVRGVAENFFVGYREDGGITENVQIFGETAAKGRRTAGTSGISNGAQLRRWAEPAGTSLVRICVGEKAAIAFCKNTFDYDVADYAYKPELNCRFRVVARTGAKRDPIDVTLTAPFRDLRTRTIRVNGQPVPKERVELNNLTDGEDAYLRGVRPGDVIEVGDAAGAAPAPADPLPYRSPADAQSRQLGSFRTVDLTSALNEQLEMRFGQEGSWYGWLYGLKWRDRIPYYLVAPALTNGRACVKGDAQSPPRITCKPATHLFAVFGVHGEEVAPPTSIGRVRLTGQDGARTEVDVTQYRWLDVNCDLPIRTFNAYVAMLSMAQPPGLPPPGGSANRGRVCAVEVLDGRLFAATTLDGDEALAAALRHEFGTAARVAYAKSQQGRYATAWRTCDAEIPWVVPSASHRLVLDVTPNEDISQPVLRVPLDLDVLAQQAQADPVRLPCSVRCVDLANGRATRVPAQFDQFKNGRGTLVIVPADDLRGHATKRYVVYFGGHSFDTRSVVPRIDERAATFNTGPNGVRWLFSLSGEGDGPRLTDVRFDSNGDGRFEEPNVLGKTGYSGGYGCLTAVYDPYFWFNFGHYQTEPAQAAAVHDGPASTTVAVANIQVFGVGGPHELKLKGRWEGKTFTIGPKGVARWFFRTYAGRPYLDQWVEWEMDDGDTCWTRPLQARYGLARFDASVVRTGGRPGEPAAAQDFCVLSATEEPLRPAPLAARTKDGHVVEVLLGECPKPGSYATSFWRMAPSAYGAENLKRSLAPVAVETYALERLVDGRHVRQSPRPAKGAAVSTLDGPVVEPGPEPALPGTLNWDSSFEKTKQYWTISRDAAWSRKAARTGRIGALLEVGKDKGKTLALVQTNGRVNHEMALEPNTTYHLTFWARCASKAGRLNTNLYWGRGYDFHHVVVDLPGDSKWHRYQAQLRTGQYPQASHKVFALPGRIFPSLRLWCLGMDQVVHVDDVCLSALP